MRKYTPLLLKITLFLFLSAVIVEHRSTTAYWRAHSDPLIDLLLYIGIGAITAFLTSLAGHLATDKRKYRWTFYMGGGLLFAFIAAAGIRNYRAALTTETPKQIVMEAVNEANTHTDSAVQKGAEHTDDQIKVVRKDLGKSRDQISELRTDLTTSTETLASQVSKTESTLKDGLEKLKPQAPELAKLQFSFYTTDTRKFPLTIQTAHIGPDGVVVVDFMARASDVGAIGAEMWVQICESCIYAKEPERFDMPKGTDEHVRHRIIGNLNPGVYSEKMSVDVKAPAGAGAFDTAFHYSCTNCGRVPAWEQTVKTIILH